MVRREGFGLPAYLAFAAATVFTLLVCVSLGSVKLPLRETFGLLWNALAGRGTGTGMSATIVFSVRLPRVLCVALTGASLSVCGAAMQGLLKNPLADGSTLGVSSGASLGAVISIAFGVTLPGIPLAGTMSMAMLFAFLSLVVILGLAYRLDGSLSTGTIILIGVIYSMFVSSVLSLVITFAPDKVQSITFWTMGSLAGRGYVHVLVLLGALVVFGGVLFGKLINLFAKKKINPMIGAAGISAFPMSSRVIAKMAKEEDPYNFILMQAAGANVAGQVASVIAGGIILALVGPLV